MTEELDIPFFSEEKLKQILKYTDLDANPTYEAFKSREFYEIQSGAKGVSKSFGGAIISIYRLVNEKIFNSVWCRNQYNHINGTLRPMFAKVLDFLKEEHNLDYTPFIKITADAVYWNADDGGKGRAIYFQNFEKTQAFQGITLPSSSFRFGELVIDEPIEDPNDSKKTPYELEKLYELQEEKIPLLIQNTVLRSAAPETFQLKVKFFYNIFTVDHFLIKNYHNKVIPIMYEDGSLNTDTMNELLSNHYIKRTSETFEDDAGINVIMFAKTYVPKKELSKRQLQNLNSLKEKNYRLWCITVAGFAFEEEKNRNNFFMRPYIIDKKGGLTENIELITENDFLNYVRSGELASVWDGFDPGKTDNASWCRLGLLNNGSIIIINAIEDLKELAGSSSRSEVNKVLLSLVNSSNELIKTTMLNSGQSIEEFNSVILTDNDIINENLNLLTEQYKLNDIYAAKANRRDTKTEKFGIISRQNWQIFTFSNKLVKAIPTKGVKKLFANLIKQIIPPGEEKRDETAYSEIYDLINAFEMAASYIYKFQFNFLNERAKGVPYE